MKSFKRVNLLLIKIGVSTEVSGIGEKNVSWNWIKSTGNLI